MQGEVLQAPVLRSVCMYVYMYVCELVPNDAIGLLTWKQKRQKPVLDSSCVCLSSREYVTLQCQIHISMCTGTSICMGAIGSNFAYFTCVCLAHAYMHVCM